VCIPDDVEVKRLIFEEGHKSRLSLHPGMTKMSRTSRKTSGGRE